ncbi:eukaryotic translation initiation factor 4 gamma 3-like isoform X2 [Phymastichus coffea]|nr:eukaryotic translation initiation factor 4 gamma 3-like isoform X2 [Phymastichus coffea]XP_058810597.1 eukaryotic translation initiation factor 4 gamma 3-like isoform X2 [Phymastichus coffea]
MGKQTHIQTQPTSMYVQNQSRSANQNYYSTGPRNQQSRNLSHRSGQQAVNQSQVVGMPGVGNSSGQPTAIYPHPGIAMQPSTLYVQSQVSGLHASPHQQNVYPINSQIPMQYTGPPQRHQTHQNQFQFQSYPAHTLITSNFIGYTHGAQHHGYYYSPTSAQINLRGTGGNNVTNTSQHLPGSLSNTQGAAIVPQGTLQQQAPQATQTIHGMNVTLPQTDVYPSFNNTFNNNMSTKSKRQRSKAITDIVNPDTGKNISAEIYEEEHGFLSADLNQKASPQTVNNNAVAADFAARVAKLASESIPVIQPSTDLKEPNLCITNAIHMSGVPPDNQPATSELNVVSSIDLCNPELIQINSPDKLNEKCEVNVAKPTQIFLSNLVDNVLPEGNDSISDVSGKSISTPEFDKLSNSRSQISELFHFPSAKSLSLANEMNETDNHSVVEYQRNSEDTSILESNERMIQDNIQSPIDHSTSREDLIESINEKDTNRTLEDNFEKIDIHLKTCESKNVQKQKNKSKVKIRELNKTSVEKGDNEMESVFDVSLKIEASNDQSHSKQESSIGYIENIKGKDSEFKRDVEIVKELTPQLLEKNVSDKVIHDIDYVVQNECAETTLEMPEHDSTETIVTQKNEENAIGLDSVEVVKQLTEKSVDQPELVKVTQTVKNINTSNNITATSASMIVNTITNTSTIATTATSTMSVSNTLLISSKLKYVYSADQWSPINTAGKKVYGREFLMKLQNDPNSKIKPSNLPDLDVVLKDNSKTRSPVDFKLRDTNIARHDSLLPGFAVRPSSMSTKPLPANKKSHSGKPKSNKPNVIHVSLSLRDDVKLRETENAWKPTRLLHGNMSEEQAKTDALYKRVRSVLNKLTPQKFETLVNQVRELQIDTQERLQGVIDLVFEKAVDEPNFSVAYALMCRELANMQVTGGDVEDSTSANFRKLILTRCQTEFQKNTVDEKTRNEKLYEINECIDTEKKKELQTNLEEEERRMRMKSVGNIRFIGELFKQNMLTSKIMHQCIQHLLKNTDEENLECLCKLLTTIGKALESKNIDLSDYFKQMQQIANRKGKVSSRIRFMLQDVIDLRTDKWVPRRDDSNPKTMDQIQREAELERLEISNAPVSTLRKDERPMERKRNRGGAVSLEEGGWSQAVGRTRQVYSVETSKLKNKPPSMDDMQLGSRSNYVWPRASPKITTPNKFSYLANSSSESDKRAATIHLSGSRSTGPRDYGRVDYKTTYEGRNSRNGSYVTINNTVTHSREKPSIENSRSQSISIMTSSQSNSQSTIENTSKLSDQEMNVAISSFIEEYIAGEEDVEAAIQEFRKKFPILSHATFVREITNAILEKPDYHRNKTSQLLARLLSLQYVSLQNFENGLREIIEASPDLIIDIPMLWEYFAKILVHPILNGTYPLTELKNIVQPLSSEKRKKGKTYGLITQLLLELNQLEGAAWTNEKWNSSGLHWNDFVDDEVNISQIIKKHGLEFLIADCTSSLSFEKIHEKLLVLLKDSDFDEICNWIQTNVNERLKETKFIRTLMTAILETSIEQCNDKWIFKVEIFDKLQKLIQRYVDADDSLELQCLFAVQAYIHKLRHPAGLLLKIMNYLCENNVLSNEAFLAWEKNEDSFEREGKSVAVVSLKSFFIPLKEVEDISSGEDA